MKYIFENKKLTPISTIDYYELASRNISIFSIAHKYYKMDMRKQQIENRKGRKLFLKIGGIYGKNY